MATTRSRPRGRETARPNVGGVVAEHMNKIWASAIGAAVVIVATLTFTGIGHTIDLAVQHFMLFYAGVLALIALCASVGAGLVSTDRMFLHPGQRVMMQSIHRAASFGALTFLIIHIVTEILAQRVHVIDAFVPFLQPFKTFYVGLGTIASDIIILLVITGILRKRFVTNGKGTWRWRAIHYTNYVAFVFGVWHGLLGGRPGKPYVDWSYGFVVAFVGLGIAIRILANSLRPKEALSAPAVAESATSGTAPLRTAMLAQSANKYSAEEPAAMMAGGSATALTAAGSTESGSTRVMQALPAGSDWDAPGYYDAPVQSAPPVYEPGYDGPPRYQGAPGPGSGWMQPVPDSAISGPLPQVDYPREARFPDPGTMPTLAGSMNAPMPHVAGAPSGAYGRPAPVMPPQLPPAHSGGFRRPATGPMPLAHEAPGGGFQGPGTGPMPRVPGDPSGGFARPATGPMPQMPQGAPSGGFRRPMTGQMQQAGTEAPHPPVPQAPGGPSGPYGRPAPAPMPPAGYNGAPYGGAPHEGAPYANGNGGYDDGGYDSRGYGNGGYDDGGYAGYDGYGGAPQWDAGVQDPRRAYRGGDVRR